LFEKKKDNFLEKLNNNFLEIWGKKAKNSITNDYISRFIG
jgi:hypothetical protein